MGVASLRVHYKREVHVFNLVEKRTAGGCPHFLETILLFTRPHVVAPPSKEITFLAEGTHRSRETFLLLH